MRNMNLGITFRQSDLLPFGKKMWPKGTPMRGARKQKTSVSVFDKQAKMWPDGTPASQINKEFKKIRRD